MKNYKFIVTGKVQGVYYRINVKNNAIKANFRGYVKNLVNGTVEACVSCLESEVDTFIQILKNGSTQSRVTNIQKLKCNNTYTKIFEVR